MRSHFAYLAPSTSTDGFTDEIREKENNDNLGEPVTISMAFLQDEILKLTNPAPVFLDPEDNANDGITHRDICSCI